MASPISGMDAVDNGDGTATTYYDDGSTDTWVIDTGDAVRSTPADPVLAQAAGMASTPENYPMYSHDDFMSQQAAVTGGLQAPSSGMTATTAPTATSFGGTNPAVSTWGELVQQARLDYEFRVAQAAKDDAYRNARLQLVDIPMVDIEKERLAQQAATQAEQLAIERARLEMQDSQFTQNLTFQYAQQKQQQAQFEQQLGLQAGTLTGNYNGQQTLASQELQARIRQMDTELAQSQQRLDDARRAGDLDRVQQEQQFQQNLGFQRDQLAQQNSQFTQQLQQQGGQFNQQMGLNLLNLVGQLRGPQNAFQQQAVLHGVNGAGLSNAVDAIAGRVNALPGFQAPQAGAQGASLQSLLGQVQGSAGTPGSEAMPGGGQYGSPNIQSYLSALPDPNKIVGRNFVDFDEDTRNFLLSGYEAKGYSPNSVLTAVQRQLPGFQAPTRGGVM